MRLQEGSLSILVRRSSTQRDVKFGNASRSALKNLLEWDNAEAPFASAHIIV
ncbi:hypothetical protein SLEP1_g35261 [Rubroshorea leprosula]|uniref:Uncharacterized protein n=1 Tax=Rubroshorea leprosula TaxID=152421 RepID=A0AAV5KN06_9ROSI|nr:hypothetical protein SLEP1_g35261 [Rubroshorea leprosula]